MFHPIFKHREESDKYDAQRSIFDELRGVLVTWSNSVLSVDLKGAQSRYFELFWPHKKLPLNGKKPENNS